MAAPVPGRCGFYLERKKRFCKMIVAKGNVFCGEHGNMEEGNRSRRIVCPLDPKHTVCEERLAKHLKKCNSRQKPKPVYYVEDVNAGPAEPEEPQQQQALCQRSRAELQTLLHKLKEAVRGLQSELQENFLSHSALQDELSNPQNGDAALKHLKQQASILGNMEALRLLGGGRCFVEFGAGRGKLSHWIHEAVKSRQDVHFLLVERCSTRFKVDGKNQDAAAQFERLQVDIQHLDLSKVPLLQHQRSPVVGVGKHLCGAATDLALRCLFERKEASEAAEPPGKRPKPSEPTADPGSDPGLDPGSDPGPGRPAADGQPAVCGLAVALCCHHRCEWRHYVGRDFFLQRGLGAAEFEAFCRMSSWATCGQRAANQSCPPQHQTNQKSDEEEHEAAEETEPDSFSGFLSAEQRQHVGLLCKRLIDGGRLDFLRRKGFAGRLSRYCSTQLTLENVLLTAVPSTSCRPEPPDRTS